jgi:putative transposase
LIASSGLLPVLWTVGYASVSEARASIGRYLDFFNTRRPHQGLGRQTPDQAYFNALLPIPAAA